MMLWLRKLIYVWFFIRWGDLKKYNPSDLSSEVYSVIDPPFGTTLLILGLIGNWSFFWVVFLIRMLVLAPFAFFLEERERRKLTKKDKIITSVMFAGIMGLFYYTVLRWLPIFGQ